MLVVIGEISGAVAEVYGMPCPDKREFQRYIIPVDVLRRQGIDARRGAALVLSSFPDKAYAGDVAQACALTQEQQRQVDDISRFLDWD
jgi:hypothetical protein